MNMRSVKGLGVSLAYLGAYLCIAVSKRTDVCVIGTMYSKDVQSFRWVLPYEDPCVCTAVRLGGHLPYKPATGHYLEGLFLSEDSEEIHKFFDCRAVCDKPHYLGVGLWPSHITPLLVLQATNFTSSSNDDEGSYRCTAASARLNFDGGMSKAACWKPAVDNPDPGSEWVSVRLGSNVLVSGIITQGRGNDGAQGRHQWVTRYKVEYSTSENVDQYVEVKSSNGHPEFQGNTDKNTPMENRFQHPVIASSIRVKPMLWQDKIALRFELLGCLQN